MPPPSLGPPPTSPPQAPPSLPQLDPSEAFAATDKGITNGSDGSAGGGIPLIGLVGMIAGGLSCAALLGGAVSLRRHRRFKQLRVARQFNSTPDLRAVRPLPHSMNAQGASAPPQRVHVHRGLLAAPEASAEVNSEKWLQASAVLEANLARASSAGSSARSLSPMARPLARNRPNPKSPRPAGAVDSARKWLSSREADAQVHPDVKVSVVKHAVDL